MFTNIPLFLVWREYFDQYDLLQDYALLEKGRWGHAEHWNKTSTWPNMHIYLNVFQTLDVTTLLRYTLCESLFQ